MKLGIDVFKHFLAVFVILQHMTSSRYSADVNVELGNYINVIDGAVAAFFLISGYFSRKQEYIFNFAKSQAIRLLVPFFLFSFLYTIALFVLGKGTLIGGFYKTITLHGAGMQLYFLPYLLGVGVTFAVFRRLVSEDQWVKICGLLIVLLVLLCIYFPTVSSTGSNLKLLPFYFLAYTAGFLYQKIKSNIYPISFSLLFLFLGFYDQRFFDLSGMMMVFYMAESLSAKLGKRRAGGSGGVYLLHTPIVNFSISIVLTKLGLVQMQNIFFSVVLTYVLCVVVSLAFIKVFPKYRWLILE